MTTILVPERSRSQRLSALDRANEVRKRRADEKREIVALGRIGGSLRAAQILRQSPSWAASMRLVDLLLAVPRVGDTAVGRMLRMLDVSPRKTVAGLSPRQRGKVAQEMERLAEHWQGR